MVIIAAYRYSGQDHERSSTCYETKEHEFTNVGASG
jgi:hypothetical protein